MSSSAPPQGGRSSAWKNNSSALIRNFFRSKHRMLSQAQRTTILELHTQGVGKREIARILGVSRVTVRQVLRSNSATVPELQRPEKAEPYRQQILELFDRCKGNLVRVHEELTAGGAQLSYAALTAFCRRHGIGYQPPVPLGHLDFPPGKELQHDTSPHEVELGGEEAQDADGFVGVVLLADAVFSVLSDVPAARLQGVSHRGVALYGGRAGAGHD